MPAVKPFLPSAYSAPRRARAAALWALWWPVSSRYAARHMVQAVRHACQSVRNIAQAVSHVFQADKYTYTWFR